MPQNRQRYTPQPTKTDKAVVRGVGIFHMIFGTVFALVGLSVLPVVGLFALPFILAGGFFAVNGWRVATFKAGNLKKTMGAGDDPEDCPSALKFDPPVRPQRPAAPPRPAQTRRAPCGPRRKNTAGTPPRRRRPTTTSAPWPAPRRGGWSS